MKFGNRMPSKIVLVLYVALSILLSLSAFFSFYGSHLFYAAGGGVLLIWLMYEVFGMIFLGKWYVSLGEIVDIKSGVRLDLVWTRLVLLPIYILFAFLVSFFWVWG